MFKSRIRLVSALLGLLLGSTFAAGLLFAVLGSSSASASTTCTIYWTGAKSSAWGTAGNWSLTDGGPTAARTPAASDYVCMSTAPTTAAATITTTVAVGGINWPQSGSVSPSLTDSGTLTVGNKTTSYASAIDQLTVSGSLAGTATVTVPSAGSLVLNSGSLAGVHLINSGSGSVNAQIQLSKSGELENAGTLNLTDSSDLIDSDSTATLLLNDASGTIAYASSAAGTTYIETAFNNAGAVRLTGNGTLYTDYGNSPSGSDTGSYNAATGTQIEFNSGTRTIGSGSSFSGAGAIQVGGASVGFSAPTTIPNLQLSGGSLDGPAAVTIPVGGTFGYSSGTFTGAHLINDGTATDNGYLYLYSASEFENAGTLNLTDGNDIVDEDSSGNLLVNDAGGTIAYSSSTAGTTYIETPFNNAGAVKLTGNGTLYTDQGNSPSGSDTGSYNAAAGTQIDFYGGTRTIASGSSFPGDRGDPGRRGQRHLHRGGEHRQRPAGGPDRRVPEFQRPDDHPQPADERRIARRPGHGDHPGRWDLRLHRRVVDRSPPDQRRDGDRQRLPLPLQRLRIRERRDAEPHGQQRHRRRGRQWQPAGERRRRHHRLLEQQRRARPTSRCRSTTRAP